jgi:hypothetical protein
MVVPTNEELAIARQSVAAVRGEDVDASVVAGDDGDGG